MVDVAIFDYGAGNIFSLKTSLEKMVLMLILLPVSISQKNMMGYYFLVWETLILQFEVSVIIQH